MNYLIKYLLFLCICALSFLPSLAQKGEKNIGIIGGYNTKTESAIVGASFQYRFSRYFRISPDIHFMFRNNNLSGFAFNGNVHFPIKMDTRINFYPLIGVTYQSWRNNSGDEEVTAKKFGANIGGGFEYMATPTLKLSVEGKYSWISSYPNANFYIGIGYLF
ncbi:MAG: outer membrane beta-barrel protein [Muribaculaceae bacterium]|nr:outer membrane beta-barrel protein [Muribaculaceae bacterium]